MDHVIYGMHPATQESQDAFDKKREKKRFSPLEQATIDHLMVLYQDTQDLQKTDLRKPEKARSKAKEKDKEKNKEKKEKEEDDETPEPERKARATKIDIKHRGKPKKRRRKISL